MAGRAGGLRIGVVLHPSRDVSEPLRVAEAFTARNGSSLVQLAAGGEGQRLAPEGEAADCDLVVAIGGDGTALAAIRTAAPDGRPVLGVGCGSLGALSAITPHELGSTLERFVAGDWTPVQLPALEVRSGGDEAMLAYNDAVLVRRRQGQLRVSVSVDGELYARLAGDGGVVSTVAGSSAYALAAGGPLLAPGLEAFLFTPLPSHGGAAPPLVVGVDRRLEIELLPSYGGARPELDGRVVRDPAESLAVTVRPDAATLVAPPGRESFITGLRRRGVIADSPRIVAEGSARDCGGVNQAAAGGSPPSSAGAGEGVSSTRS